MGCVIICHVGAQAIAVSWATHGSAGGITGALKSV